MIILVTPVSHGPHIWYAAQMWCIDGHFMDFLRLKATHVNAGQNEYYFLEA